VRVQGINFACSPQIENGLVGDLLIAGAQIGAGGWRESGTTGLSASVDFPA
jgi:hypothetical protein